MLIGMFSACSTDGGTTAAGDGIQERINRYLTVMGRDAIPVG